MYAGGREGTLVGRELELAAIEQCLASARQSHGAAVLLGGEAGIGKTRMLSAGLRAAVATGYRVAATANIEQARSPFAIWIDALRILSQLVPELVPSGADRAVYDRLIGDGTVVAGSDKRRLFVLLSTALQRAAHATPVAVGIDDAQWLDPESLELLEFAVPRLATSKVVLLLTVRTERPDDAGAHVLNAICRFPSARTIRLGPLSDGAAREMIVATAPRRFTRPTVDAIVSHAGGNPLFLAELVRSVAAGDEPALRSPTISRLVQERLRELPRDQQRPIEAASAIGMVFAIDDVAAITAMPRGQVVEAMRAAYDAGLLAQTGDPLQMAFRHGTIRDALYGRMLAAERIPLHRQLAELLERAGHPAHASLLAHHWRNAGEARRAAELAVRAGDEAMLVHGYASARDRYRDALNDEIPDEPRRAEVEAKLGQALDILGESGSAMDHFRLAASAFAELRLREQHLHAQLGFARAAHRAGHSDAMIDACDLVLRGTDDPVLRFAAHSLLAMYHVYRNDLDNGERHIAAGEALEGPHDTRDELSLRWARALAAHYRNDDTWMQTAYEAVDLAQRHGDAALLTYTLMNFGSMARERGYDTEAHEARERALVLADEHGLMFAGAYVRCQKVEALHFSGELDAAYRVALEASSLHVDAAIVRSYCASSGLLLLADLDRFGAIPGLEDSELLEAAFATGEDNRFAPLAAAHVNAAMVRDDDGDVSALIDRALSRTKTLAYTGWAVVTLARFGTPSHTAQAHALCGEEPRAGAPRLHHAIIGALFATRHGDRTEGRRRARAALDLAERQRAPLHVALLHELLGDRASSLDLYRSIGALGQVRRLSGKAPRLSRREREIADRIAEGSSNRAIADQLTLSERTVEHHAASIYAKLGFRTRAEFIASYSRVRDAASPI